MLCGLPSQFYDLHEIFSRQMCGSQDTLEDLPITLHALLCRSCNQNNFRIAADGSLGRMMLLAASRTIWGDEKFFSESDKFLTDHRKFFAEYIQIDRPSNE